MFAGLWFFAFIYKVNISVAPTEGETMNTGSTMLVYLYNNLLYRINYALNKA